MTNTVNASCYHNYSKGVRYVNKSEDKIKNNEIENKKENNTIITAHAHKNTVGELYKGEFKIRVSQMDKKDKIENKENKEDKENKEKKENKENKENIENNENKENINTENMEKRNSITRKEIKLNNKEKKENIRKILSNKESKENIEIKGINEEKEKEIVKEKVKDFIVNDEELKIKYFNISKVSNNQVPKEYINVIYYNLLKEEERGINPMPDYTYMSRQKEINDKMRSILVDWIIDVHFKFGFTDETLFMTISIIDRYLSICQISRTNFQLLGITALMIACKHEEIDLPKIEDFIYITDNAYVKEEVIKMEEDVLIKLNFSFLYPSPIKFFEYLSLHFNFSKKHHMMGKYLMETFLLDVKNAKYKPSIISCACAYIVMKFFKMANYHESYSKKFYVLEETVDKYSEHNIKECAKDICLFVDNINKTNFQACLKKYSKPEQEKVAIIIMNN